MKYIFVILTIAIGSGKKSVYTVDFIVKLGSLVSNISERNSNLKENLKKGPELTL